MLLSKMMKSKEYHDGLTEFLGCRIDLSKKPMHPRPETEFWTEKALAEIRGRSSSGGPTSVLDLFTGSGCIGIAIATHFPNVQITLADKTDYISTLLPSNACFVKSDLFSNISGKFDFILANPPYVAEGTGVPGIMDGEPPEALYAGTDGLAVIGSFLKQAADHLDPGGQIWMEFGSEQKEAITNLLREFNYYQNGNCTFHKDQHGKWRYLVIN